MKDENRSGVEVVEELTPAGRNSRRVFHGLVGILGLMVWTILAIGVYAGYQRVTGAIATYRSLKVEHELIKTLLIYNIQSGVIHPLPPAQAQAVPPPPPAATAPAPAKPEAPKK